MSQVDLSIIIPARNESKRIGGMLESLAKYLKKHPHGHTEVLIVINHSSDNTAEVAKQYRKLFDSYQVITRTLHPGKKGAGVQTGMLRARGKYRIFMDADLATPLHHLEEVRKYIKGGSDVIIGVRNLASSHKGLRKLISNFGNLLVHIVLGLRINDTQCGFKAFRDEVAMDIFAKQKITGWGFDMEVLAIAKKRGYSIAQIPINDWQDVAGGSLNNVAVTGALSTFKDLLRIRWNLLRGIYKQVD